MALLATGLESYLNCKQSFGLTPPFVGRIIFCGEYLQLELPYTKFQENFENYFWRSVVRTIMIETSWVVFGLIKLIPQPLRFPVITDSSQTHPTFLLSIFKTWTWLTKSFNLSSTLPPQSSKFKNVTQTWFWSVALFMKREARVSRHSPKKEVPQQKRNLSVMFSFVSP